MLASYLKKDRAITSKLQAYIGVLTSSPLSVYSILMIKKSDFSPIKLNLGQIQSGRVQPHEKKFYFF